MQTLPTGSIYWLGNNYKGKFENISINNVLGHLFSRKAPQNTDLGIVKKLQIILSPAYQVI